MSPPIIYDLLRDVGLSDTPAARALVYRVLVHAWLNIRDFLDAGLCLPEDVRHKNAESALRHSLDVIPSIIRGIYNGYSDYGPKAEVPELRTEYR